MPFLTGPHPTHDWHQIPCFAWCRYDRANTFRKMVDCQFVSAMGPPGGGRSFITPRFARHFHHVSICELDNKSMTLIFGTILGHYLKQVLICSSFLHQPSLGIFV